MSLFESASLVVTPNGTKASKLYAIKPTSGAGDLSVTRATTATRVNSTGLIESVANNVPRLDYTNSTCPSILVEPQRTNVVLYSEAFENANWNKNNLTLTNNNIASPSGNIDGDLISANVVSEEHNVYSNLFVVTPNVDYTFSYFVKKGTGRYISVAIYYVGAVTGFGAYATYDLNTNTLVASGAPNGTFTSTKLETFANGWVKISVTGKGNSVGIIVDIDIRNAANLVPGVFFTGANETFYIWGAQLELGSYPTSYIPTTTTAVTRNADVISKTGISSLIGQTEGTLFVDFNVNNISSQTNDPVIFAFSDSCYIEIYSNGGVVYVDGTAGISIVLLSYNLQNGRHKFAVGYQNNNTSLYIDGILAGSDNTGNPTAHSSINLGYSAQSYIGSVKYNSLALWKTKLTTAELIELTTL